MTDKYIYAYIISGKNVADGPTVVRIFAGVLWRGASDNSGALQSYCSCKAYITIAIRLRYDYDTTTTKN